MTGSQELLEALPRDEVAHVAPLTGILDVLGSCGCWRLAARAGTTVT